jgi:hypothetical protein
MTLENTTSTARMTLNLVRLGLEEEAAEERYAARKQAALAALTALQNDPLFPKWSDEENDKYLCNAAFQAELALLLAGANESITVNNGHVEA